VRVLLTCRNINVNETNNEKQSALHFASKANNEDIVRLLLNYGCSKTLKDRNGNYPYMMAKKPSLRKILFVK